MDEIRAYFDRYKKYDPNKWCWMPSTSARLSSIEDQEEWNRIYRETRMRRSPDKDLNLPEFTSLEKDAEQFGLLEYDFVDTFGLGWHGKKGKMVEVGPPDYEGHLYCYIPYGENDEGEYEISPYNDTDNQPDPEVFYKFDKKYPDSKKEWIDIANIKDIKYHYIVENHLFKDTYIDIIYGPNDFLGFYSGDSYDQLIKALEKFNKKDLLEKLYAEINKHFEALKNSEHEDERAYWPECTAEEYFKKIMLI